MAGLIHDLMGVVGDMSGQVEALTALAHQKKKVVIKNDTDALKEITAKENDLVGKYQKADKKASEVIADIAMVLNQPVKGMTFGRVGELISEQPDYAEYMRLVRALEASLEGLKRVNEQNRVLIESALDYIDYSINFIRSSYGQDDAMFDSKN